MQKQKPVRMPVWMKPLVVLVLLGLIIFLFIRANQVNQQYLALAAVTPKPSLAPPSLAFRQLDPLFRFGSVGPEVIALQQRLSELGYYTSDIDGKYYEGTQAAVKSFQEQNGLAADGIAGEQTLQKLNSPDAQPYRLPVSTQTPDTTPEGNYISPGPDGN
jgi:peptidoglycan hydrolase-like protein with peptidoglycan-binding domain